MKITIEEFAEIVVGILVKHIFDALIGSGASGGGV